MALYPVMWQIECDQCGSSAKGVAGVMAQDVFTAALQSGWTIQIETATSDPNGEALTAAAFLRCMQCSQAERDRAVTHDHEHDHEQDGAHDGEAS